ncbi:sensor histidine kinase [Streptomyces gamaensis]|uniref:Sensor histidine kinase n=1 Tax=Streptomyces gamaensis TaxID=1763542 RepID=A0ABW0YUV5_9ACTN
MDVVERPDATIRPGGAGDEVTIRRTGIRLPAPGVARGILLAAWLSYLIVMLSNIFIEDLPTHALVVALTGLAVSAALQYVHSTPEAQRRLGKRKYVTLAVQALCSFLPIVIWGPWWGSMAGFFCASLLLLLPTRPAWTLNGVVGISMFIAPLLTGHSLRWSFYYSQSSLLCGVIIYGLSHFSHVIQQLHDTRTELARRAVTQERLRFARDLHDLLGYSLSSITLKTELIRRLIPIQPQQAEAEVGEVLTISRQSLADVRTVASGYREMSLEQEIASARSVLSAAEVDIRTDIALGTVGQQVDTTLATVLREAVTNLLRHSKATRCTITVNRPQDDRIRMTVTNDGADPAHRDVSPDSGSGLGNLATRLEAIGGRLAFSRSADGTFRLEAEAPAEYAGEPPAPTEQLVPRPAV